MTLNLRSFAQILAEQQGGVRLKPGKTYVRELTEAQIREIFGDIPAAVATSYVTINVREIKPGIFQLLARLESST
jgi:hypothetical protein